MAEPQYRYGGPIPESVQRLKKRREGRASSLYATVMRGRARNGDAAAARTSSLQPSCEQMAALAAMGPYLPGVHSSAPPGFPEPGHFPPGHGPGSSR